MKYAALFSLLGATLVYAGLSARYAGLFLVWFGVSFLVVAAGYAWLGPRVFGKRADGTMAWWNVVLLLPYLLFTWGVWHLQRLLTKEPGCHEIAPGIWLGRRPMASDLPAGTCLVVDLAAEFPACRGVARGRRYLCLPALDTSVPARQAFEAAVRVIAACEGPVYIHCALGHGRSAALAAAALLAKGLAQDAAEAEEQVRAARPQVRLSPAQRRLLRE